MERALTGKVLLIALVAISLSRMSVAQAQDKPLKKISWGVTSLSASNWIPWIAKDAKIYEKNGLDVELVLVKGSGQTSVAILGGSLFAAPVAVPQVMMANLGGADLVNIAHTVPGVQSKLLVKQEILPKRLGRAEAMPRDDFPQGGKIHDAIRAAHSPAVRIAAIIALGSAMFFPAMSKAVP